MPPEKPSQSLTASLPATRRWKRSAYSPSASPSCRSTVSIQLSWSQLSSLIALTVQGRVTTTARSYSARWTSPTRRSLPREGTNEGSPAQRGEL